jgi:hypothetical protein
MMGHVKIKVGQTTYRPNESPEYSASSRIAAQMGTSTAEEFVLLQCWVIEQTDSLYSDKQLHNRFLQDGVPRCKGKGTEWFAFPYTDPKDCLKYIESRLDNYYQLSLIQKLKLWLSEFIQ